MLEKTELAHLAPFDSMSHCESGAPEKTVKNTKTTSVAPVLHPQEHRKSATMLSAILDIP